MQKKNVSAKGRKFLCELTWNSEIEWTFVATLKLDYKYSENTNKKTF